MAHDAGSSFSHREQPPGAYLAHDDLRYAHLSPKHLTSAVRVLDTHSISSLDSYLTIQPKQAPEGVLIGVGNDGVETNKRLDRRGKSELVPKAGFEPAHPCGR